MADVNFIFIDNLAYTEDTILVYNLFIYRISNKVTENDCRQYLTRFGEISRFRFNTKPNYGHRRASRHAFVDFKNAETAASVLRKQFHTISPGKVFSVKACDSWHQPQKAKLNPVPNNVKELVHDIPTNIFQKTATSKTFTAKGKDSADANALSVDSDSVNILDLNEDCHLIILKYLPLRDQVSLARSHNIFETIFKTYAKIHYKNISTENLESMSLWNIRQLFMLAGEFFEKFTFVEWFQNKDRDRIASFVQYNCPNLQKIKLDTARIRVPSLHKILTHKPHLTQLSLNCLSINDHCIHAIKRTPTLEHLTISQCYNFTGRFLHLLPQLKTLRLAHCSNLQASNLHKAISAMPNLIALDITGADRLNKSIFDALPQKNQNLEILEMSCINACYDNIALLPKLRCLGLHCDDSFPFRTTTFRVLAEKCVDKLESLKIVTPRKILNLEQCQMIAKLKNLKKLHIPCNAGINGNSLLAFCELKNLVEIKLNGSANLKNNELLELVRSCPKLKWVNVQNTPIDNEFAKKLLPIIKKDKRENGRITFLVAGSQMIKNFTIPAEYSSDKIKSMVEFIFEHKSYLKSYDNLYDAFENDYNGLDEVPFFEVDLFASDSDDHDDDDDDDSSLDLEDLDFLLNIPLFEHLAYREALGYQFGYDNDSDDDDDDDQDVYLW